MSVLARRARDADDARYRALLALRDSVISEITRQAPPLGSLHIEDAVDTALSELLAQHLERRELLDARRRWVRRANSRLKDRQRSAAFRLRDPIPVDAHPLALSHDDDHDPLGLPTELLDVIQLQEIIAGLAGVQRQWADAAFALMLAVPPADGSDMPTVGELLGWSAEQTRKTAWRTHKTIAKFVADRASGTICSRRQALLDAYIAANETALADHVPGEAARPEFQAVALHIDGCEHCQLAWSSRHATLLERGVLGILAPLDILAAVAQAGSAKLAGLWTGAQQTALMLLQRLGIGGGAASLTLTAKTATVCVAIACVAGADELTGVLSPLRRDRSPELRQDAITPLGTPARAQPSSTPRRTPTVTTPPTPTRRSAPKRTTRSSTTQATASATHANRPAVTPPPPPPPPPPPAVGTGFTPGDLPPASTTPPPAPPPPPAVAAHQPTCTPGDLGC